MWHPFRSGYNPSRNERLDAFLRFGLEVAKTGAALAEKALQEAANRFKAAELHNGRGDAWRHCFWSALMQVDPLLGKRRPENANPASSETLILTVYRDAAYEIGWLHEIHGCRTGQPIIEFSMDMHNNGVGLRIGKQLGIGASVEAVIEACDKALSTGELIWIENGKLTRQATYDLLGRRRVEKRVYDITWVDIYPAYGSVTTDLNGVPKSIRFCGTVFHLQSEQR